MQVSTFPLLVLFSQQILAQELEPINLCSAEPLQANKSGVITYNPTSAMDSCSLTLIGLQNGDHISLLGVMLTKARDCSPENTWLRINGQQADKYCTGSSYDVKIVTITETRDLRLEVEDKGTNYVQIYYYQSEY